MSRGEGPNDSMQGTLIARSSCLFGLAKLVLKGIALDATALLSEGPRGPLESGGAAPLLNETAYGSNASLLHLRIQLPDMPG